MLRHSCSKRLGVRTMLLGYAQRTPCGELRPRGCPQASGFFPARQNQPRRQASMIGRLPNFSWRLFASNVNDCGRGVHGSWQGAVGTSAANRNFFLNKSGAGNACLSGALRFPRPRLCLTVVWPIPSEFRPLLLSQLQIDTYPLMSFCCEPSRPAAKRSQPDQRVPRRSFQGPPSA